MDARRRKGGGGGGDMDARRRRGGVWVTWTPAEGGGGGDMDARRRRGGGVGEMGFRVGPFVLCENECWRQRHRNTKIGPKKFFPPIIPPPPTFE